MSLWSQEQDRRILGRINTLLTDIRRNGNEGIGKPEALERWSGLTPRCRPRRTAPHDG